MWKNLGQNRGHSVKKAMTIETGEKTQMEADGIILKLL